MNAMRKDRKNGFTLTEMLISTAILLLVVAVSMSTYLMLSQYVKDLAAQAIVQGKARVSLERMVRDIREAASVTCQSSGNEILLTYDPQRMGLAGSGWTSRYRLNNGQILFTADTAAGNEIVVVENVLLDFGVKLLEYNPGTKLVTINLKIRKTGTANVQDASLSTIVKVRNAY